MTQALVRAQIVDYLSANASTASGGDDTIPFLNVVSGFPPKITPEGAIMGANFPSIAGIASGAVIFLYIRRSQDRQIEFRGTTDPNGKFVYYDLDLICVFYSEHAESEQAGEDNEAFVDGLKQAIRNSKNCGGSGPVFSWGQGDQTGTRDISVESDLPQQIQERFGKTMVRSICSVTVLEDLTG